MEKTQGLIDSGATHALRPLRPGESCANYKTVNVTLANGQQAQLRMTPGGVMVSGCADVEPPYLLPPPEKKEGEEELKPGGFDIKIFRLAAPMITKTAREVTKTAMDFILKLRMDGFHIGRIHSDRGHEFSGVFRKWAISRGIVLTRTPGDDPRANGRVEVAVKSFKTQMRRLLKQADVGSECWPLAARCADALNRSWRLGDAPSFPPFMQDVLVRRRTWRQGVFEPTVETVKYLFPAPEERGHWVQAEEERPRVTKYVLRKAKEPITDQKWVAIEKEVAGERRHQ